MSLPINLFKGAYLGAASTLVMSALLKDDKVDVRKTVLGTTVLGIGVVALVYFLGATLEKKQSKLNRKVLVSASTGLLQACFYGCVLGVGFHAFKKDVNLKRFSDGIGLFVLGGTLTSLIPIESPKLKSQSFKNFTPEDIKEINLGGMSKHFEQLQKVFFSRQNSQEAKERGIKPVKGILLYGPPGTGKTTLAKNLGKILGCSEDRIILKAAAELKSKWHGESERNVRELFTAAWDDQIEHGEKSPLHIIVLDEIDVLIGDREENTRIRVDNSCEQFLTCLDGLHSIHNIVVIGITNRYHILDKAAIRPGRFDIHIEIGLPDLAGRKEIFQTYLKKIKHSYFHENLDISDLIDNLAKKTTNFSGADIEGLVNQANLAAFTRKTTVSEESGKIIYDDFLNALETMHNRENTYLSPEIQRLYA